MTLFLAMLLLTASVLGAGAAVHLLPAADPTRWLKPMLAFSGAYLFSITILHLLPETLALGGAGAARVGYWVLAGFFLQMLLELASEGIEHGHIHHHPEREGGYGAVLLLASLVIHSALEGSILTERSTRAGGFWPVLLGVVLHHIPAALALMSVLLARLRSFRRALAYLAVFAVAAPLGMLLGGWLEDGPAYPVLAGLVAGNFLHISTTILFETTPEHRFNRRKTFAAAVGVALALVV